MKEKVEEKEQERGVESKGKEEGGGKQKMVGMKKDRVVENCSEDLYRKEAVVNLQ